MASRCVRDGVGNGAVFGVDEIDDLQRRGEIDRRRVRGFRRSVSRGSMNVMSRANLCGVERDPQQHEDRMFRRTLCLMLLIFAGIAERRCGAQIGPRSARRVDRSGLLGRPVDRVRGRHDDNRRGYWSDVGVRLHVADSRNGSRRRCTGRHGRRGAGFATAPLTYCSAISFNARTARVAATRTRTSRRYMAFVRGGGGLGWHRVSRHV